MQTECNGACSDSCVPSVANGKAERPRCRLTSPFQRQRYEKSSVPLRYGEFFCDNLGESCASRAYKLKARRAIKTTGRVWSVAEPLHKTPANKRNPDGVTECPPLFSATPSGLPSPSTPQAGAAPLPVVSSSLRPFGNAILFHGLDRVAFSPQQGNQRLAAHQVAAAYGNHARGLGDILHNDRYPLYIPVILDFMVVVVL